MFDLKFQNHRWCRPLSPFTGGAKLSNCKKIFCRPPVVVVQHDHHQRQCHTCHTECHCYTLRRRRDCKWVLGAFSSLLLLHILLYICSIFCSTYCALLKTAHFCILFAHCAGQMHDLKFEPPPCQKRSNTSELVVDP